MLPPFDGAFSLEESRLCADARGSPVTFGKESMRAYLMFLLVSLTASGCTSHFVRDESRIVAGRIGVDREEVTALARQASERHKRSIVWIRMSALIDGAFEVGLTDQLQNREGIIVIFRKIDGSWQEDPASELSWVTKQEPNRVAGGS